MKLRLLTAVVSSFLFFDVSQAQTSPDAQKIRITRAKEQAASAGPAANFTGSVRVQRLFQPSGTSRMSGGLVSFDAGARSAWHSHPLGQVLIVTAGVGRVQRWGDAADEIRPGDVVWIPPGQKHWHGASPDSAMSHIALLEVLDGRSVEWMEKVTDQQYTQSLPIANTVKPTAGKQLMGDIAPKLADLTDDVLFGDVWERPGLSKRDRSLITVSTLIAMNRPDQLRSHMTRARDNGVTEEELVETITQLAFYAGWPSAVTAVGVAREVFKEKRSK